LQGVYCKKKHFSFFVAIAFIIYIKKEQSENNCNLGQGCGYFRHIEYALLQTKMYLMKKKNSFA